MENMVRVLMLVILMESMVMGLIGIFKFIFCGFFILGVLFGYC